MNGPGRSKYIVNCTMCKHILNAQVSVRAPCCKRWFDCPQCHHDATGSNHKLLKVHEIVMACKKCKKVFRKDSRVDVDEADEFCPYCDNQYVLPAVEPDHDENINFAELLQQQLLLFNDPRMKDKFADLDQEFEALLQE